MEQRRQLNQTSDRHRRIGVAVTVLAGVLLVAAPSLARAASTNSFSPFLVTRAGTSNVIYALWSRESCSQSICMRLERSTNGGATFTNVSVPPTTPVAHGPVPLIDELTFANPLDGYAVESATGGPVWAVSSVFATTNGGRTWKQVQLAPHALNYGIVASTRFFYAITSQCPIKARCRDFVLHRSSVGSMAWSSLAMPKGPADMTKQWGGNISLAAYGPNVWLTTQDETTKPFPAYLATSHNEGASFSVAVQPDLQSLADCGLLPVSTSDVWAGCPQGMMQGNIVYSTDGGVHWLETQRGLLAQFGFGSFDPMSKGFAYFINDNHENGLFRVSSEFSRPERVATMPTGYFWTTVVFTNGADGVVMSQGRNGSYPNLLWSTSDGGVHWRHVSL